MPVVSAVCLVIVLMKRWTKKKWLGLQANIKENENLEIQALLYASRPQLVRDGIHKSLWTEWLILVPKFRFVIQPS